MTGDYKVVQLYILDQPLVAYALEAWETHAVILERTLLSRELDFQRLEISRTSGLYTVPALRSANYLVSGMGRARVQLEKRQAYFSGESFDYGLGIDPDHLKLIENENPGWSIMWA